MKTPWLAAWMLILLVHPAIAADLRFSNFTNTVVIYTDESMPYWQTADGRRFQVAPRIIVRTHADNSPPLERAHPAINRIQPLFQLGQTHLYLLEIDARPDNLQTVLNALEARPEVAWAQPDLLQQRTPAHASHGVTGGRNTALPALRLNWPVLQQHNRGQGIRIAIIDDGIDLTHPALRQTKVAFAYDIGQRQLDASPQLAADTHGTRVAGVLFAATEGLDQPGLVPDAELIAIRQPDTWTSNTLLAFHLAQLAGADIINCSWHSHGLLQPVADAVSALAQYGRDGRGTAVVFAAGNQGQRITATSSEAAIDAAIVVGMNSPHSNFGPSVDLVLTAEPMRSTAVDGGFAPIGGTSLASSQVTAALALLLARDPRQDLTALLSALQQGASHD